MGYYTNYKLSYEANDSYNKEHYDFIKACQAKGIQIPAGLNTNKYALLEEALNEKADYKLSYVLDGINCKWYEHEVDLKAFSKRFPEILFTLKGEGEESDDVWIKYFKNGKMQHVIARIVFDPFDEAKLW